MKNTIKNGMTGLALMAALGAGYTALTPAPETKKELACRYEAQEVESQFLTFSYQSPMLQDPESKLFFKINIEQMQHDDACFDRLNGKPTFVNVCEPTGTVCRHFFDFNGDGVIERLTDTNGPYTTYSMDFQLEKGKPKDPEAYKELNYHNEGYLGFLDMAGQRSLVKRK